MALDPSRLDPKVASLGLRNESALLLAARTINQTVAAQRLGISKQTHSEWLREHGARAAQVCAAHGVQWVSIDAHHVDPEDLAAVGRLARKGLDRMIPALSDAMRSGGRVTDDEIDTVRGDDV